MSIVTFWGNGKEQVGKTLSVVAIATNIAIEKNKKILVISASYNNDNIKKCYWNEENVKKNNIFVKQNGTEIDNGIEGLAKIIQSNKITPNSITDYTKVVFKDRLEILLGFEAGTLSTPEEVSTIYDDIVKAASKYYDLIFVDLDNEINPIGAEEIIKKSDVVVGMVSQKVTSINNMKDKRQKIPAKQVMYLIGKYDAKSKYTTKNLTRMVGERRDLFILPYNTLYFEAAEEGNVPDLFLRLRRIEDKNDENAFFIDNVKKVSEEILKRIQEEKMFK